MRKAGAMPLSTNLVAMKATLIGVLSAALSTLEGGVGIPAPPPEIPMKEASLMFSEVSEVNLDPIPPARFEIPPDLKKVDSPYPVKGKR